MRCSKNVTGVSKLTKYFHVFIQLLPHLNHNKQDPGISICHTWETCSRDGTPQPPGVHNLSQFEQCWMQRYLIMHKKEKLGSNRIFYYFIINFLFKESIDICTICPWMLMKELWFINPWLRPWKTKADLVTHTCNQSPGSCGRRTPARLKPTWATA